MIPVNQNISQIKPYIPGKPVEDVQREQGINRIVKLASNENNWGLPDEAINKISQGIKELFRYPDGGVVRLRNKLADELKVSPDQLIFGNGSDELLQMIALTYLNPEAEALISEGTFSEYEFSCRVVNSPFVKVPLKNHTYDLEGFAAGITGKTRVIFLCNPNNPTGTWFNASELDKFLKKVPENILVVIDEAYYEYAVGGDYPESMDCLKRYQNIIVLRTFSKIRSLAGCRIGYGISNVRIIEDINRSRQPFNVNRLAQKAAIVMLDQKGYTEDIRSKNFQEKERLTKAVQALGLEVLPSRTNFIFINIQQPALDVFNKLMAQGVIVRAMNGFGFPQAIRVTVGLPEENDYFLEKLALVL